MGKTVYIMCQFLEGIMLLFGIMLVFSVVAFVHDGLKGLGFNSLNLKPIGVCLVLFIAATGIRMTKDERQEGKRIEIYSLGLNKGAVNAQSFYLGRNGVEYLYYTGDSIKGFNLESIPARETTIKYTNDKSFLIINQITTTTCVLSETYISSYELYIPKGSIIEDYKVDL